MKRLIPVILLVAGAIGVAATRDRHQPGLAVDAYRPPVPPTRTAAVPPVTPDPPRVPDGAGQLTPITFTVTTTWVGPAGRGRASQHVTRTSDRVRLLMDGLRNEWLLERNPVDHRRVSGYLIDHQAQLILAHQESDLRNGQQLRGWTDALTMRFDMSVLPTLRRTEQQQNTYGAVFRRYVAPDRTGDGVIEVWWSDALLLPLRLTSRQKGAVFTSVIEAIAPAETAEALTNLADPRSRFRDYAVLDVTDSRERGH